MLGIWQIQKQPIANVLQNMCSLKKRKHICTE